MSFQLDIPGTFPKGASQEVRCLKQTNPSPKRPSTDRDWYLCSDTNSRTVPSNSILTAAGILDLRYKNKHVECTGSSLPDPHRYGYNDKYRVKLMGWSWMVKFRQEKMLLHLGKDHGFA